MDKAEFQRLRDLPNKKIIGDIRLREHRALRGYIAEEVRIENSADTDLRMTVSWNPETDKVKFNVYIPGIGPICRLEVRSKRHGNAGRSHKHSVENERCPDMNLPIAVGRVDLENRTLGDLFGAFCEMASITHEGRLVLPSHGE